MIIAAFAGCGKTTFANMNNSTLDLHSMPFKYFLDGRNDLGEEGKADPENVMRPEWPYNYISAIENVMNNYKYVLIPSDFRVMALLEKKQIQYTLVYPHRNSKYEYLERYINRENSRNFLSIFYGNWEWFIDNLESDTYGEKIVLQSHQFLSDVIKINNKIGGKTNEIYNY